MALIDNEYKSIHTRIKVLATGPKIKQIAPISHKDMLYPSFCVHVFWNTITIG